MQYNNKEEFWNTLTHGIGALLSIPALILMIIYSNTSLAVITSTVFGLALIILYTASTLYHATRHPKRKEIFHRIDHLAIYLLIAGTYTPISLVGLGGFWGWTLFGIIWGFVVIGFFFKFSSLRYNKKLSLTLYVIMGSISILVAKPLIDNLSPNALIYLLVGILLYSVGIYFYVNRKIKYHHAIWHLFVLGGSTMHFVCVFFFILP